MEGFGDSRCDSGLLAGMLEYLNSKAGVREVSCSKSSPASASQIISWEKANEVTLPDDLREFYLSSNGLELLWSYEHNEKVLDVGCISVNSIDQLLPLGGPGHQFLLTSNGAPAKPVTNDDLDTIASQKLSDGFSPNFGPQCKIFTLDYCSQTGHICLVYNLTNQDCGIWLLDLSLMWHSLASCFSDYFRLAVVHLGLTQWPYALTSYGLSPQYERLFRLFIPKRLEIDLATVHEQKSSIPPSLTRATLDTSKILLMKSHKDKKSKLDTKQIGKKQGTKN